jgi:putative transposase
MFPDRLRQLRHSEEEIRGILLEVSQGLSAADACRKHGISQQTYYRWRRRFGDESQRNRKLVRLLEEENVKLKRLLAEKELELHALRLVLERKRSRR